MLDFDAHFSLTSVACAIGPSFTTSSTDFLFRNLVFLIYLNFQQQKSLQNQLHPQSKSYQINSINSCSSRSFQHTKGTFQFLQNFQLWFNLVFSEEIIQCSKNFCTTSPNVMELSPCSPPHRELSKDTKNTICSRIQISGSHKQNKTKQTTFLHT
jgi:hypothetical protein